MPSMLAGQCCSVRSAVHPHTIGRSSGRSRPMPRRIILDCDPGHDDALAMLVAYGNPAIDLLAVTTVCGNQTVDLVTRNALVIGTVAGMTDVVFARGAERP